MKNTTMKKIAGALVPAALILGIAAPALAVDLGANLGIQAETSTTTPVATVKTSLTADAAARASEQIENRINVLTALLARVNTMQKLSASVKATLTTSINESLTALNDLKIKIASDTAAELKADMLSITQGMRVYALLVPKTRILAAADRATILADMFTGVDAKIKTRISEATTAGRDVSAIVTAESDMTAKVADAKVQAAAAISLVSGLTPDGGDKTKMAANLAALKTARTDLKAAESDLRAARKDLGTIIAAFKAFSETHASVENSATVTVQ